MWKVRPKCPCKIYDSVPPYRQLSLEKKELELSVTKSQKAAQRMSQNVEELQWRIRNNFELPVEHCEEHYQHTVDM